MDAAKTPLLEILDLTQSLLGREYSPVRDALIFRVGKRLILQFR